MQNIPLTLHARRSQKYHSENLHKNIFIYAWLYKPFLIGLCDYLYIYSLLFVHLPKISVSQTPQAEAIGHFSAGEVKQDLSY